MLLVWTGPYALDGVHWHLSSCRRRRLLEIYTQMNRCGRCALQMMPVDLYDRCIESYCVAASDSPVGDNSDTTAVVCDFLASFSHLCVTGGVTDLRWRTPNTCR